MCAVTSCVESRKKCVYDLPRGWVVGFPRRSTTVRHCRFSVFGLVHEYVTPNLYRPPFRVWTFCGTWTRLVEIFDKQIMTRTEYNVKCQKMRVQLYFIFPFFEGFIPPRGVAVKRGAHITVCRRSGGWDIFVVPWGVFFFFFIETRVVDTVNGRLIGLIPIPCRADVSRVHAGGPREGGSARGAVFMTTHAVVVIDNLAPILSKPSPSRGVGVGERGMNFCVEYSRGGGSARGAVLMITHALVVDLLTSHSNKTLAEQGGVRGEGTLVVLPCGT